MPSDSVFNQLAAYERAERAETELKRTRKAASDMLRALKGSYAAVKVAYDSTPDFEPVLLNAMEILRESIAAAVASGIVATGE